jgi:DNA polymerase III subunit epsilon
MTAIFVAIDVETANRSRSSICQIGLAAYDGPCRIWEWSSLVNPQEPFDNDNVAIHGLRSSDVQSAPLFPAILQMIAGSLGGQIIASHTSFDRDALNQAAEKYNLQFPTSRWIDTCAIAKMAWPNLSSHALDRLCRHFALALDHHNALVEAV